jgi:hypothetical protein
MRCDAMRNEYYKLYTCGSELKNISQWRVSKFQKQQQQKKRSLLYLLDNFSLGRRGRQVPGLQLRTRRTDHHFANGIGVIIFLVSGAVSFFWYCGAQ